MARRIGNWSQCLLASYLRKNQDASKPKSEVKPKHKEDASEPKPKKDAKPKKDTPKSKPKKDASNSRYEIYYDKF